MFRRVPPVYSPLSLGALVRGGLAALFPPVHRAARAEIDAWLRATFRPRSWAWTDSGTTALTLALRLAVDGRPTRRIALPAYGCYDLATACDGAGVEVLLYDIDPATLGPDWASLERALADGAEAVVVAYLYGIPVDLDRVRSLTAPRGVVLIEDAAQGTGASYDGRPLGAHGDLAVLSFGRGKGLTAGGGGAILGHEPGLASRVAGLGPGLGRAPAGLVALAKTAVQWALARPGLYWIPASLPFLGLGETVYRKPAPAGPLSRSGTGVLSRTIRLAAAAARARREAGARWEAALRRRPGVRVPQGPAKGEAGYLRFPVLLDGGQYVMRKMLSDNDLDVTPGYPDPLYVLDGFRWLAESRPKLESGSQVIANELVTFATQADPGRLA